jgi:putative hydrolase of the HAD superfamily
MQGREDDLRALLAFTRAGKSVVIQGPPGIGKTTLLQALQSQVPEGIFIRLEQGGNAMRDLRLGLHRSTGGDFPVDDDQGIALLARMFPGGGVILVDNADELDSAKAIRRLITHLPELVVVVTSRGQSFPGFEPLDLRPLSTQAAAAILSSEFDLSPEDKELALRRGRGNPQLIKQEANALEGGEAPDDDRLSAMLSRFDGEKQRLLWLIGELPLATLPLALMSEVGRMDQPELELLRRNAVAAPTGESCELHQTLRGACRNLLPLLPRGELQQLLQETANFYLQWLSEEPDLGSIDDALPNLMHLLDRLEAPRLKVDLALALIGDRLDDPCGYLPSRGLTGLLREKRESLQQAAVASGGVKAAKLEKNLGLFCHWGDDPAALELVLSARSRFQDAGDLVGRAGATWVLGIIADDTCRYADAEALYREPLEWLRDDENRAVGHQLVGCSLYHQGRYEEAYVSFEQAKHATQDPVLLARIERRLLYVELLNGDVGGAIEGLKSATDRAAKLKRPRDVARINRHIGEAYLRLFDLEKADRHFKKSRAMFEQIGDRRGLGATLLGLATTRRLQKRLPEAGEMAEMSRDIAVGGATDLVTPVVSPFGLARAVEEEARILFETPATADAAIGRLRHACNIYEVIGHSRSTELAQELGERRNAPIPKHPAGILFDVADTLSETKSRVYEEAKVRLAEGLGADKELFMAAWVRSRRRASVESGWTTKDRIEWVARELGLDVDGAVLDELAELEKELWRSGVALKSGARSVLDRISAAGTKIALVSNGTYAMREMPRTLGLESVVTATVISSVVGMLKPDPAIYRCALENLGLSAEECIFVGDGSDRELEGAQAVGLFAVRMQSGEKPPYQTKHSLNWDATVHSLDQLARELEV